jgi:hypothetical protein
VIARSTVLCHVVAVTASALLVLGVTIFWDRSAPFEYRMPYVKPAVLHPGDRAVTVFRITKAVKICAGSTDRFFIDKNGRSYVLGRERTVVDKLLGQNPKLTSFENEWWVPVDAPPGPGIFETRPQFWCNPFQRLLPIRAPVSRVPVLISAPGVLLPPLSLQMLPPAEDVP